MSKPSTTRPDAGENELHRFDRLSLRFTDPVVERRFNSQLLDRSLPLVRLSICVGMLLYAAFGLLDVIALPASTVEAWVIRYAVVCPALLAILAYSYAPGFRRHSQRVLGASMLLAGGGIIAMTVIGTPPGTWWYYAGLILVVIYCSNLTWLRFRFAAVCSLILCAGYAACSMAVAVPWDVLASNLVFLTVSVAASLFASYVQELYARRSFIAAELLLNEKQRADELLEQARAGLKAREEFLAIMGHELRTPLNAIIGFSEIMKQRMFGPLGSTRYDGYVDDIHNSGTHLLSVINTILDLSKAQAKKLSVHDEMLDLVGIVDGCLRMFRETAAAGGVRLSFDRPPGAVTLTADARLLRQVLINLVSNAVKFTPMGGSVEVSVDVLETGDLVITVVDTGIGIAEDDMARVLEPFVQVENSMSRGHPGTGLGLPLAVRIAELHGGSLELSSRPGMGTSARLRLPAARVARAAEAPPARVGAEIVGDP